MTLGISTYAYQWRSSERVAQPMRLGDIFDDALRLGLTLVQVCDWAPLEAMDDAALHHVRDLAAARGLTLETGTKGIAPAHLRRYLAIASRLGSTLVRSMLHSPGHQPDREQAQRDLREVMGEFESAGVTLALETYEQVSTPTLVELVDSIDSPNLGICLDPGNVIASLEHPDDVIDRTAAWVRNVHVKDFSFTRDPDMVGFRLAGCPMGEGLLDLNHLLEAVRPHKRGINVVIEQWCPWQGDAEETMRVEAAWVEHAVRYLRAFPEITGPLDAPAL